MDCSFTFEILNRWPFWGPCISVLTGFQGDERRRQLEFTGVDERESSFYRGFSHLFGHEHWQLSTNSTGQFSQKSIILRESFLVFFAQINELSLGDCQVQEAGLIDIVIGSCCRDVLLKASNHRSV